jgi:hypothetical protein
MGQSALNQDSVRARLAISMTEHKGRIGRLPQALIKRPQPFPVQPFSGVSGKLAITNDVDHTLDVFVVGFRWRHCRLPFDRNCMRSIGRLGADLYRSFFKQCI